MSTKTLDPLQTAIRDAHLDVFSRRRSKPFVVTVIAGILLGCSAIRPLEETHTANQLEKMYATPPACEQQYGMAGWVVDRENCAREGPTERERIREAWRRRHAADLASAPACLQGYPVPRRFLEENGVDPDRIDAVAEIITRGAVISGMTEEKCGADVCEWMKHIEPESDSPYCARVSPR